MRVLKFNDDVKSALQALEFEIADDSETATIRNEMTVELIWPSRDVFSLRVTLPNGMRLDAELSRDSLFEEAESYTEWNKVVMGASG